MLRKRSVILLVPVAITEVALVWPLLGSALPAAHLPRMLLLLALITLRVSEGLPLPAGIRWSCQGHFVLAIRSRFFRERLLFASFLPHTLVSFHGVIFFVFLELRLESSKVGAEAHWLSELAQVQLLSALGVFSHEVRVSSFPNFKMRPS